MLFKQFGGVDAVPICLDTTDVEEIIETVVRLAPSFGGINLEDISAPRCFEIERPAQGACSTSRSSTTTSTAPPSSRSPRCSNALRLTGRDARRPARGDLRRRRGRRRGRQDPARGRRRRPRRRSTAQGVLHSGRDGPHRRSSAALAATPPTRPAARGTLADALAGADVYIGVSGGTVPEEVVASMAAGRDHLRRWPTRTPRCTPTSPTGTRAVVATGRSDFPNQINNVLAFPGIFRGAFDVARHRDHRGHEARRRRRARRRWSATTCAEDLIVPSPFDPRVGPAVAAAVAAAARRDGVARAVVDAVRCRSRRRPSPRCGSGRSSMFAVYAESFSLRRPADRPGGRGAPGARGARRLDDGRRSRPPSLNHHDLWSLRGVGLKRGAAADDPRLRRRRASTRTATRSSCTR